MLTAEQLTARTDRAVGAATTAARRLGLPVSEARVLHDVFSVVVALQPAAVAVRVPTVVPPHQAGDRSRQHAQQCRELAVTGWLADRGYPVVAPSPNVARRPVALDGFSMTFWTLVDEVAVDYDPEHRARLTARLHAALRDYDAPHLPFCAPFGATISHGLAALAGRPDVLDTADVARAQRQWQALAPRLASAAAVEAGFPGAGVQPVHGDAPTHNLIATADGALWSDFEMVCTGPAEVDLALVGGEAVAAYDDEAARCGLRRLDASLLAVARDAGVLASIACLSMAPQLPMLIDAVAPVVDRWRERPDPAV